MSEQTVVAVAPAKLNLTLDVLQKRPDGYHDLCMVMQSASLCDTVRVTVGTGAPLSVKCSFDFLPADEQNLAAAAAARFFEATGLESGGLALELDKQIPVCAGLGGGSSDAAAVLRALNALTGAALPPERLAEIGARVGSDVPYCVLGGTALAEGRGERLTRLPALPHCWIVLCKPSLRVSTPRLFAALDLGRVTRRPDTAGMLAALARGDLYGVAARLHNVFEAVSEPRVAEATAAIRTVLLSRGALGAVMSGTGPTVFGLFDDGGAAAAARDALGARFDEVFLAEPE